MKRILAALSIGLLLLLGLRPVPSIDAAAGRVTGVLAYPYDWLGRIELAIFGSGLASSPDRAMAAEESLIDLRRRELSEAIATEDSLRARPGVAANVIVHRSLDHVFEIDRGLRDGVAVGDPVTYGNHFAGIVMASQSGVATVRYAWNPQSRVCVGSARPPKFRGVAAGASDGLLRLEIINPRDVPDGTLLVVDLSPDGDALDAAAGFRVGIVRSAGPGRKPWIEPDPAMRGERFLNVVVRTRGVRPVLETPPPADGWSDAMLSPAGDASPGRKSSLLKVVGGAVAARGAAVAFDGWLVGRIDRASSSLARVRHVEDPGFSVEGILLPPDGSAIPLGLLVTESSASDGVVFRCEVNPATVATGAGIPLVTASSNTTVPKGLRIGTAVVRHGRIEVAREPLGAHVTSARLFGQ
jgi:hypothetical protein